VKEHSSVVLAKCNPCTQIAIVALAVCFTTSLGIREIRQNEIRG